MQTFEQALRQMLEPELAPEVTLAGLISAIRPDHPTRSEDVALRLQVLCRLLERNPDYRQGMRQTLMRVLEGGRQISLYAESGILPNTGFFSELSRRISRFFLPDVVDRRYLKDVLGVIFAHPGDFIWLQAVTLEQWRELYAALELPHLPVRASLSRTRYEMLEAVQVLSFRIAAIGLEPEMLRNEPALEEFESPFLTQNAEVHAYLEDYKSSLLDPAYPALDEKHIGVLLVQCREAVDRVKRTATQRGTSITLTFNLRRLEQNIDRMEALIALLADWRGEQGGESLFMRSVTLLCELVREENRKNNLRDHFSQTLDMVALRITENASRTGEHYITETRSEYLAMLRSALGGGLVIAFMALLKVVYAKLHLAPLNEAIVFSLNYGIGFMLIHMLGFTVATKQPAMTAAAIAASIDESGGKTRDLDNLVTLIARTVRSQIVAIIGNIGMVVPVAMLLGGLVYWGSGEHFVSPDKAGQLLDSISPFGMTLIYAAVAGVCLFLAGQIAGYYDNLCVYNRIPGRLRQLRWLRRLLGEARLARFVRYVENNLGALAGNFYFGLLLGGMAAIGVLFGVPVDIRHITFSGAYWSFSLVALDFGLAWQTALLALCGVLLIGLVNLAVSFTLALMVALKARRVTFGQGGWPLLLKVWQRFWKSPREFLMPPRKG
jgi:site-specific recombinase